MDNAKLINYVGQQHADELQPILNEREDLLEKIRLKNPKVTLFLSIFLGMFRIDRLYQDGVKIFLCKLAMLVFSLGTWWIADIGYSIKTTQETNYNRIVAAL